jgi:hypothetical protein
MLLEVNLIHNYFVIVRTLMTISYDVLQWLYHMTYSNDNIIWHTPMTISYDNIIWHTPMTISYDILQWQYYMSYSNDNIIWHTPMTISYVILQWQYHMTYSNDNIICHGLVLCSGSWGQRRIFVLMILVELLSSSLFKLPFHQIKPAHKKTTHYHNRIKNK